MTSAAQASAALALALGFALLGARRAHGVAMLCAAQAAVVAIGALAQGNVGVAAMEFVEAGVLGWWGAGLGLRLSLPFGAWSATRSTMGQKGSSTPAASPQAWTAPQPKLTGGAEAAHTPGYITLVSAALLAALAVTIPGTSGLPLAVVLLGLLLLASHGLPAHQALGVAAMQNGLVLAAVATGLSHAHLALVVVPWLPALALGALWLGADRARTAWLRAPRPVAWADIVLCGLALLIACTLPWQLGAPGAFWRIDALAAQAILLLTALATAASWAHRDDSPVWGSQVALLAGAVIAVASSGPLQGMLGLTLATAGAAGAALPARAEAWRRLRLGCLGLGLAWFGAIAMHAASPPLAAAACAMLGYGALAVLAPELTVAGVILIVRLRGATTDDLLLALGLAALLVAALSLAAREQQRRSLKLVSLAQGGAAVFAFGLGTEAGNLAGLLQLSFLALTHCALLLARRDGLDRLAALAGLGGQPPFGVFPSLALILAATAARTPWLLLPLGAGLAAIAWAVLLRLPAERRLLASPAWVPLVLLLIAGFAMPDPVLAWFRLAAR